MCLQKRLGFFGSWSRLHAELGDAASIIGGSVCSDNASAEKGEGLDVDDRVRLKQLRAVRIPKRLGLEQEYSGAGWLIRKAALRYGGDCQGRTRQTNQ